VPGLANRLLGRLVGRICLSLPRSERFFPPEKTVVTGNPVRQAIIDSGTASRQKTAIKTLLVLGGSQGAQAVNRLMVEAVTGNADDFSSIRLIHQTGRTDEQMVGQAYAALGLDHQVQAFFTDMAKLYRQADLIVSRAGATTLAEIGVVGTPAVLIPYPFAADNHQEENGAWYAESGAAVLFPEKDLSGERLAREIINIFDDEERLKLMAAAMKKRGITDAAERIVKICLELRQR
jgi:UDP-N-acetylglucosamine--N-acetylmuramyl-(pentapeptide) pyrophosphoryl-undecaprenol N-acetylglucosamine transferase